MKLGDMDIRENSEIRQKRIFGRDMLCLDKGCKIASPQCKSCSHYGGIYNNSAIICNLKDDMETSNGLVWRKAKAGHNFGKDTVVLYNGDPDARLVRCAVNDCIYIHIEDLLKLPKE